MDSNIRVANRVFQLESHHLDREFNKVLDQIIDGLDIPVVSEEVKLLAKLYLQKNHASENTSLGMKVYNLRLHDTKHILKDESIHGEISKYKFAMLGACNLIVPYLLKRNGNSAIQNHIEKLKLPWLSLESIGLMFKLLNILNFITFLRDGKYLLLQHRLLGVTFGVPDAEYYNNMAINKVQMELMGREMIWQVFADFLTTIMPMINLNRFKNQSMRVLGLMPEMSSDSKLSERLVRRDNINTCAICSKQPFNPFIIGCRHLFCYYCLHSAYLSDPASGYACQSCKYSTKDQSQVQRYKLHEPSRLLD